MALPAILANPGTWTAIKTGLATIGSKIMGSTVGKFLLGTPLRALATGFGIGQLFGGGSSKASSSQAAAQAAQYRA